MPKSMHRLSTRSFSTLNKPGRHADGANLYLAITPAGSKSWLFIYKSEGKQREMGLGSAAAGGIGLARARECAANARDLLARGIDPLENRQVEKRSLSPVTFGQAAKELIASKQSGWKNAKHGAQWTSTLTQHTSMIMAMPVDMVDTNAVLSVLQPIWKKIPETATRVRGRIEAVLNYARVKKYRTGENPALWRGHLQYALPSPKKNSRGPQAALHYSNMAPFMGRLRANGSCSALALEFTILTGCRTGEAIAARFCEFDIEERIWTVPAIRTKTAKDHEVPLSGRAYEIIGLMRQLTDGNYVFPGLKSGCHLTNMAMLQLLDHIEHAGPAGDHVENDIARGRPRKDEVRQSIKKLAGKTRTIMVHGFRATFRTWASEETEHLDWVCEKALGHTIPNKVERAYRRGQILKKRRALMDDWAAYCSTAA